jgi:phosphoserine phosphatase RsbU/P
VVRRLNRQMVVSTSDDRFATLFFAIYDSATRELRYTNAGHPAPLCIAGEQVARLGVGGTIIGAFPEQDYEQARLSVEPGTLLVAFSDGLIEPENVYGEEFGVPRLTEVALRHRRSSAPRIVEALLEAAEEWSGTPEQADDMTVIVARLE